jgi:hypothetical protein
MVARLLAALAAVGLLACCGENCASGACACADCPQARLSEAHSGSTVDFPQGYRVEVTLPAVAATSVRPAPTLSVSDGSVLLVQTGWTGHALQFVTGKPGRARVTVSGTSFVVDLVVHRWQFGSSSIGTLNPYNPVTANARVGQEFGIFFYTSLGEPISVVSNDSRTVQVLDAFTAPLLAGPGHFAVIRAAGRGQARITMIPGTVETPSATVTLFPITVKVG